MLAQSPTEWITIAERVLQVVGGFAGSAAFAYFMGMILLGLPGPAAIARAWSKQRRSRERMDLVRDMLSRGMSADEIASVLTAAKLDAVDPDELASSDQLVKLRKQIEVGEIELESGLARALACAPKRYTGDEIHRVVAAARRDKDHLDEEKVYIAIELASKQYEAAEIVTVLTGGTVHGKEIRVAS